MAFIGPFQSTLQFHSMNWYNQLAFRTLYTIENGISAAALRDSLQKKSQYPDPAHTRSVSPKSTLGRAPWWQIPAKSEPFSQTKHPKGVYRSVCLHRDKTHPTWKHQWEPTEPYQDGISPQTQTDHQCQNYKNIPSVC